MDRYERKAEEIMRRGDLIIEKRKQRSAIIRRISVSGVGALAAAIVGVFALKATPMFMDRHSGSPDPGSISSEVVTTQSEVTNAPAATTAKAASETTAAVQTTQSVVNYITETQAVQTTRAVQSTPETAAEGRVQTAAAVVTNHESVNTTAGETSPPQQTTVPESVQATQTTATGTSASGTQVPGDIAGTVTNVHFESYKFYSGGELYHTQTSTINEDMLSNEPIDNVMLFDMDGNEVHDESSEMYRINGYSQNIMAAVWIPNDNTYHLCVNTNYSPHCIQEMLDSIGYKQNWHFLNSADLYGEFTQYTETEWVEIINSLGEFEPANQIVLRDFIMKASFESNDIFGCKLQIFFYGSGSAVLSVGTCRIGIDSWEESSFFIGQE